MNPQKFIIPLLFLAMILVNCEETNKIIIPENITITPGETKANTLTKAGWQQFENGNFSKAVESFNSALLQDCFYNDAYNGLGWAYSRMDSLDLAISNFKIAIISSQTNSEIFRDASAGRAFANLAMDEYDDAIRDVTNALRMQYSYFSVDYVFRHDKSITELDLLLVQAECYFLIENYQYCYNTLLLIDDTLIIDQNDPAELAAAIEKLKSLI